MSILAESATPRRMRRVLSWLVVQVVLLAACADPVDSARGGKGGSSGSDAEGGGGTQAAGAGGASGGDSGGQAGGQAGGGSGGATEFVGPLGRRCSESVACEAPLVCFAATGTTFSDEGPAGGFCTQKCASDADCASLKEDGATDVPRCVALVPSLPDSTVCMPGCHLGDKAACGGRPEVACWALDSSPNDGTGRACVPLCNNDEQCPSGTLCDGATNLCSPLATGGGLDSGETCDPTIANPCKNGFCYEFEGGAVCTSYCRRGTFPQCGGIGEDATCGWVFSGDEKAGPVDAGMCAETCACNRDCAAGSYCALHEDRTGLKKPGICTIGEGAGVPSCP